MLEVPILPAWVRAMREQLHQSQRHSRAQHDEHERASRDGDDDHAQEDQDFKRIENSKSDENAGATHQGDGEGWETQ